VTQGWVCQLEGQVRITAAQESARGQRPQRPAQQDMLVAPVVTSQDRRNAA
jgi:hypothetical protein